MDVQCCSPAERFSTPAMVDANGDSRSPNERSGYHQTNRVNRKESRLKRAALDTGKGIKETGKTVGKGSGRRAEP